MTEEGQQKGKKLTIKAFDEEGKEVGVIKDIDNFLLVVEANNSMKVNASGSLQWMAYSLIIADNYIKGFMMQEEMSKRAKKGTGLVLAQNIPSAGAGGKIQIP